MDDILEGVELEDLLVIDRCVCILPMAVKTVGGQWQSWNESP